MYFQQYKQQCVNILPDLILHLYTLFVPSTNNVISLNV